MNCERCEKKFPKNKYGGDDYTTLEYKNICHDCMKSFIDWWKKK